MRIWLVAAVAAAVCGGTAGADDNLPKPQTKPGLWLLEKHTNMPIFIAPAATAADAAKRSEQALVGPGMKLQACLNPEEQQKHLDLASNGIGCTIGSPQVAGDTVMVDSVCHDQKIHTVYWLGPGGLVASTSSRRTADTVIQRSEVRFDSPEHLVMEVSMPAPGDQGVPLIEKWDFRWLSADCQGLAPGQFKPLTDKPETRR